MNCENELKDELVQVRMWLDCINHCSFCSEQNFERNTTVEQKRTRIVKTTEFIKNLGTNRIGIIGGEFFNDQLRGCENEWILLMEAMRDTGAEIFINSNLLHKQYYLDETIEILGQKLLICTSYDEVGRFHTQEIRENWFKKINELHDAGVNLFCTSVPTQELFETNFQLPEWLGHNLEDPHLGLDWYLSVDKAHYHELLVSQNTWFNLPKRATAIRWMRSHIPTIKNYVNYQHTHSDRIYGFDSFDNIVIENKGRLDTADYINPKCGHHYYSQCYADSDKCMMCDAERVISQYENSCDGLLSPYDKFSFGQG